MSNFPSEWRDLGRATYPKEVRLSGTIYFSPLQSMFWWWERVMNKLLIPGRAWVSSPTAAFIDVQVCSFAQRPKTEGSVCGRAGGPSSPGQGQAYLSALSIVAPGSQFFYQD